MLCILQLSMCNVEVEAFLNSFVVALVIVGGGGGGG